MAFGGMPVDRLRDYLRELPSQARALLMAELERALLRGEDVPGGDLLLQEVRSAARESGLPAPRIDQAARLFFRPLEPFLVDDDPARKHPGRVARTSLQPMWDWICRDVMPSEVGRFSIEVGRTLATDRNADCESLVQPVHERLVERVRAMLTEVQNDDRAYRRTIAQIGTPRALEDVHDLLAVLAGREILAAVEGRLPGHVRVLADAQLADVKALLDAALARSRDLLPYLLVLVMGRLASPWQLIRLAVAAAESDDGARVAATPYSLAVTITLADVARMVAELKADLKRGQNVAVISLLKCLHDALRGLRSELDLSPDSPWSRELAAIRSEVSAALTREIDSTPGRVRRLLRPRPPGTANRLDPADVEETEALIELLGACRNYASELAISEVALRAHTELQQFLDTGTQTLLDGLRNGGGNDRQFRQSQIDVAVRFCARVFGQEYAALLGKAAEVAANSERKAAKA
jgi:hypothetical protein